MSSGKPVALVTGASKGIGASIVEVLRANGIHAVGAARATSDLCEFKLDVRDEKSVRDCFAEVISTCGRLDILVNNAGIVSQSAITDCSLEEWESVMTTNLTGAFLCAKHAIKHFLQSGDGGVIVNVSSIAGRASSPTASEAYTCSKYGLIGLTKQLAQRYASANIRVNCVCPSQTLTPMLESTLSAEKIKSLAQQNPSRRLALPVEVANAVWFLASNHATYINGAVLDVNGGKL